MVLVSFERLSYEVTEAEGFVLVELIAAGHQGVVVDVVVATQSVTATGEKTPN